MGVQSTTEERSLKLGRSTRTPIPRSPSTPLLVDTPYRKSGIHGTIAARAMDGQTPRLTELRQVMQPLRNRIDRNFGAYARSLYTVLWAWKPLNFTISMRLSNPTSIMVSQSSTQRKNTSIRANLYSYEAKATESSHRCSKPN